MAGTRIDDQDRPIGPGSESVVVATVDTGSERTTIRFGSTMDGRYERSSVVIHGNVATASHGESVRGEPLGDGDAGVELQSFELKKKPLTYVPQPGAHGGVASTLQLRVDGVRWTEVGELYGQAADARVFVSRRDADQTTRVQTGDGRNGSSVPTGRNNVTADYRVGLGPEGNVGGGSLRTLLMKPLGLRRVLNPGAAAGGANREDPAAVKQNAPGTVRTFGRIVSIRDFEDAAREYVGVSKARASFVWDGESRVIDLVVAGDDGAPVDIVASGLRADLDARRDPHQPLVVRNFEPRPIIVRLSIVVDAALVPEVVRQHADDALRALLAFGRLDLGEAVSLSDVHRDVQRGRRRRLRGCGRVPFQATEDAGDRRRPRLLVAPHQLVSVADPGDLVVTVSGSSTEARRDLP